MSESENEVSSSSAPVNITPRQVRNFWRKVNKDGSLPDQSNQHYAGLDQCWVWTASKSPYGYGYFNLGKRCLAHRISWAIHNHNPEGFDVCHQCDNPSCVNPNHLFLGSPSENMADKVAKNRNHKGEQFPQSKATEDSVREIRRIYAAGGITQDELCSRYGISSSVISRIITRKIWKHVA